MALAATLEAVFTVMGQSNTTLRQCPVAMGKWLNLVVAPQQTMLGLALNTRQLYVAILPAYRTDVLQLLNTTWRDGRCAFYLGQAQTLVGKFGRLGEEAYWVYHLMSHMYTSISRALAASKVFLLEASPDFNLLVGCICTNNYKASDNRLNSKVIHFAMKQAARQIHHCKNEFFINDKMKEETASFRHFLPPGSGIDWETPIAFMILRTPFAKTYGGSCLEGGGGYLLKLKFWWHFEFEDGVIKRTLKHGKNNIDGQLIYINVLEFVTVIINYCATLTVVMTKHVTDDPHPVLLNVTDNTAALN